jgi:hypothetical protein
MRVVATAIRLGRSDSDGRYRQERHILPPATR